MTDRIGTLSPGAHPGGFNGQDAYTGQLAIFVKAKRAQTNTDDETWNEGGVAPTLNSFDTGDMRATTVAVSMAGLPTESVLSFSAGNSGNSYGIGLSEDLTPPLRAGSSGTNQTPTIQTQAAVRRLTPTECERLQGFPDGWTAQRFDFRKQAVIEQADSNRYKQMGNAVAVPVFEWVIGRLVAAHSNALPVSEEGAA